MGQAASITLGDKSNILYDMEDFTNKFHKATMSTIAVPMVIVAFPILNAYKFSENEYTGVKVVDSTIGGLLGVVGWPLSPFVAFWSAYQSIFTEGPNKLNEVSEETKRLVRRAIGLDCDNFYNIAVVGAAGTGKSSLVNGILGYPDTDRYAATINEAGNKQIKNEPRGYRHPDLRRMILWDMPGAGTITSNDATYFEDNYLQAFDSLIIVTAERLQTIDLDIAAKAQEYHIPVLFVRNRCDQSLNSKISRLKEYSSQEDTNTIWAKAVGELVKEVRRTVFKQLKENKISAKKLFLLSAWSLRDLMSTVNYPTTYLKQDIRLIDEQRFIQALMDAVLKKRRMKRSNSGGSSGSAMSCTQQQQQREQTDSGITITQQTTKQVIKP